MSDFHEQSPYTPEYFNRHFSTVECFYLEDERSTQRFIERCTEYLQRNTSLDETTFKKLLPEFMGILNERTSDRAYFPAQLFLHRYVYEKEHAITELLPMMSTDKWVTLLKLLDQLQPTFEYVSYILRHSLPFTDLQRGNYPLVAGVYEAVGHTVEVSKTATTTDFTEAQSLQSSVFQGEAELVDGIFIQAGSDRALCVRSAIAANERLIAAGGWYFLNPYDENSYVTADHEWWALPEVSIFELRQALGVKKDARGTELTREEYCKLFIKKLMRRIDRKKQLDESNTELIRYLNLIRIHIQNWLDKRLYP